jgi:hypothetical protein
MTLTPNTFGAGLRERGPGLKVEPGRSKSK